MPFIVEKNGIIKDVSISFEELTGFNSEEIINKPFDYVWNELLRITRKPDMVNIQKETYIFTKSLEVRCVFIDKFQYKESKETKYFIHEIPGSRFEDNNQFLNRLITDNKTGVGVFTVPDFIFIKVNQAYLDYFPEPYNSRNKFLGKCLREVVPGFEGSTNERVLNETVINNQTTHKYEQPPFMLDKPDRYWDYSLTPVSVKGEVKYIVAMIEDVTQRVMSRDHIKKQNRKINAIIENMTDAVYTLDKEGNCTLANKAACAIFGANTYTKVQNRFQPGMYFDLEDNELGFFEMPYARALNGERVIEEKMKIKMPSETRYLGVSATPILDENGEVELVVICARDITRTESQSQIIREQKEELEAIIDNIQDAIFIFDSNHNCILKNKSAKVYSPDEEARKYGEAYYTYKYYDMDGNEVLLKDMAISKLYRGETVKNLKLTMRNSEIVRHMSINGATVYDSQGKIKFTTISCRDITQDIEMQKTVERQKEELEAVIENIDDAIFIYDKNFNYYMKNKAARDYFPHVDLKKYDDGYIETKYYDRDNREIPHEEMALSRVRRGEIVKNYKMKMVQGDKVRYINVSGRPVYDSDNSIRLGILYSNDITEDINREAIIQKQQELILKKEIEKGEALKKAMELKDEFLYLITHEFRTPMAVVNSALQVINLACREEITERLGKYLRIINQNTNRQLRLVNNLLDITRISSGNIRMNISSFDSVQVIGKIVDSIKLYAQQKNVNIYFNTTLGEKYISSDEEKLERIMLNLLSNALKFTQSGKSIYVDLSEKKYKRKSMIFIDVRDEGIGIPREKHKIIFERFGQVDSSLSRRAEGTGLGLHLVKLLVDALKGKITLKSRGDEGSTFTVMLPLHNREAVDQSEIVSDKGSIQRDNSNRVIESSAIEFSDIYF